MAQRTEPHDSLDFFPTPPWATRALVEHILAPADWLGKSTWEPACGTGDMARPLAEYFDSVRASDVHDYGFGEVLDFLMPIPVSLRPDWVITNPPFRLAEQFIERGLEKSTVGVAVLVRTVFLATVGRFEMFRRWPPTAVAQFAERVPMVKGRVDPKASTATDYCWIVFKHGETDTRMRWIPPCRKALERPGDYERVEA